MFNYIIKKFKIDNSDIKQQRNSRLFLSIITSVLAKFIAIGSTLITIPVTLNYLGAESFGVWMVISGIIGFMGFSDLGIGMGLQNSLSKSCGEDDAYSPKYYIANAYIIVTGIACLLALLSLAAFSLLPVELLFKAEEQALLSNSVNALKYSVLAFLLGMPITLIQRILAGLQKSYVASNVVLLGSVLSLLAILLAVYLDLGLVGISVLFILSPTVTLLVYSLYFFYQKPEFRPSFSIVSARYLKPIFSTGSWSVLVQIIYTAKMNVPTMIISSSLGLLAVAEYSIAQKLTGLAATMIGMALQPLWSVYGEAYHRGDRIWIEKTLKKSIKLVLILTVFASVFFQLLGQSLITIWLGDKVLPSPMLIACFSLWMIAATVNVCFAMLLNGTGNFSRQAIYSALCVGSALTLIYTFVEIGGLVSVVFITFLVAELFRIPFNYFESKRVLHSLS